MHATLTWLHFNTTVLSTDNRPGTELGKFVAVLVLHLAAIIPMRRISKAASSPWASVGVKMNHVATNTSNYLI